MSIVLSHSHSQVPEGLAENLALVWRAVSTLVSMQADTPDHGETEQLMASRVMQGSEWEKTSLRALAINGTLIIRLTKQHMFFAKDRRGWLLGCCYFTVSN